MSFTYTRPNGACDVININIRELFRERWYNRTAWYLFRKTPPSNSEKTICELFDIPKSRLDEIRNSVSYYDAARYFLDETLNTNPHINTDSQYDYLLKKVLGVKYDYKEIEYERRERQERQRATNRPSYDRYDHGSNRTSGPGIDYEKIRKLFDAEILSEKQKNDLMNEYFDLGEILPKQKNSVEKYKEESKNDFYGVERTGLINRLKHLLKVRDQWVEKSDKLKETLQRQNDKRVHFEVECFRQEEVIKNLQDEVLSLKNKLKHSSRKNVSDSEMLNAVSEIPSKLKKVIRNKFMMVSHPDKLIPQTESLSEEERTSLNRFFDLFQRMLK